MNFLPLFVPCTAFGDLFPFAEIAYSTPIDAMVMISEVLPELISGNGKPVGGMLPLTTSALMTVCMPYTIVIPIAKRKEKKSSAFDAARIPQNINAAHAKKSKNTPKKPNSSPMMDRIKSLSAKGKNRYFCRELNSPVPNQPPFPKAYKDWIS